MMSCLSFERLCVEQATTLTLHDITLAPQQNVKRQKEKNMRISEILFQKKLRERSYFLGARYVENT